MNWLKRLWNWFTTPNTDGCHHTTHSTDDSADVKELFIEICNDRSVGSKILEQTQAVEKFVAWYDGPVDKESILNSLNEFLLCDDVNDSKLGRLR